MFEAPIWHLKDSCFFAIARVADDADGGVARDDAGEGDGFFGIRCGDERGVGAHRKNFPADCVNSYGCTSRTESVVRKNCGLVSSVGRTRRPEKSRGLGRTERQTDFASFVLLKVRWVS